MLYLPFYFFCQVIFVVGSVFTILTASFSMAQRFFYGERKNEEMTILLYLLFCVYNIIHSTISLLVGPVVLITSHSVGIIASRSWIPSWMESFVMAIWAGSLIAVVVGQGVFAFFLNYQLKNAQRDSYCLNRKKKFKRKLPWAIPGFLVGFITAILSFFFYNIEDHGEEFRGYLNAIRSHIDLKSGIAVSSQNILLFVFFLAFLSLVLVITMCFHAYSIWNTYQISLKRQSFKELSKESLTTLFRNIFQSIVPIVTLLIPLATLLVCSVVQNDMRLDFLFSFTPVTFLFIFIIQNTRSPPSKLARKRMMAKLKAVFASKTQSRAVRYEVSTIDISPRCPDN